MLGEPGAFFGTTSIWEETNFLDAGNDFDHSRVLHHMMDLGEDAILSRESIEKAKRKSIKRKINHRVQDDYDYAEFSIPHVRRAATR